MKLVKAAAMRAIDRRTIEEIGIPLLALMENAGVAVADALGDALPDLASRAILVVCGRGNNGGDGLVAARHLASRGHAPQVLLLGRIDQLKNSAVRAQAQAVRNLGIPLIEATDARTLAGDPFFSVADFDVILDAVFGTGFAPPAKGLEAAAIAAINEAAEGGSFVLAVDLPSGLDADSGRITGPAVTADLTVTFAAPKLAHFLSPADALVGDLAVADITIPSSLIAASEPNIELCDVAWASERVSPRRPDSHKGSYGHLLVIAGARGKSGAAILAARAALRAGVGLVTVATPASCQPLVAAGAPELMTFPLAESATGGIAAGALPALRALLVDKDAVAIGPGLGMEPATQKLVRTLCAAMRQPAVLDADALNCHAGRLEELRQARGARVLTPHPGEAARLLGSKTREISDDRLAAASQLVDATGATVVLKGHRSLTATPAGEVFLNATGNPGLATAGSGDVLTGVIGALLARGLAPALAASLGTCIHGLAGDLAAGEKSEHGLVAGDVIEALPRAWLRLASDGREGDAASDADA